MEQETGIRSLYDEFFRGLAVRISVFYAEFVLSWTYKPTSTTKR